MKREEIGLNIQLSGMILSDKDTQYNVFFPRENIDNKQVENIHPTEAEFEAIVKQLDLQEVEIYADDINKKMLVRKSQRNLDNQITWKVFQRDNYTCRYCGVTGVPMTYDHIKLWEKGGENTIENGVCSCRKCNKTRGNMEYDEWINSPYYKKRSKNLTGSVILLNEELVTKYKSYPNRVSKRNR